MVRPLAFLSHCEERGKKNKSTRLGGEKAKRQAAQERRAEGRSGRHPQAQPQAGWGRHGGRGARIGPPSQRPNRAHDVVDSDRFGDDILPS